jgi:hypothetical protein
MADYSLVPVDYLPDFEGVSLVPVDYDPVSADGVIQQAQGQVQGEAPSIQSQPVPAPNSQSSPIQPPSQPQPPQGPQAPVQPQSQPQPAPSTQPTPTVPAGPAIRGGSASPFVDFFNQLAAPERAESERVADLVRNHPTAAKIVGAIGLGSALIPPLAIAGAEGLGLFGAGAAADGAAGSTISGVGRAAAGSAARQAIAEAEATLPKGISRGDFRRLAGFEQGLEASSRASTEATAEIISNLKSAGITSRSIAAFQKIYESVARENPSNQSAVHRAALLANILRSFQ